MKVEPRGKFGGVKIHLEPEEAQVFLAVVAVGHDADSLDLYNLNKKMGTKIRDLLKTEPGLLADRTPEQVIAILAKEAEKAKLQLERAKAGADISKIDPDKLKQAMLKHVQKEKAK